MNSTIKILIAEHDPVDRELIQYELKNGNIQYEAEFIQNEEEYIKALRGFQPDIILCDFSFPSFNGTAAFEIKEKICPGTPFIIVSGTIGEQKAVELIKAGVTDYILKDSLLILPLKIKRALEEAKEKIEKNATAEALQTALSEIKKIMDSSLDVICAVDEAGYFVQVSAACETVWGYTAAELIGKQLIDFVYPEDREKTEQTSINVMAGNNMTHFENRYVHKNGSVVPMGWSARWSSKDKLRYGVARDATERKRLEKISETEKQRFNDMFSQAPSCMGLLKGPEHVFEMANPLYQRLIGKKDIIGKRVIEVMPEVETQGFIKLLDEVYKTGKTFSANEMLIQLDTENNGMLKDIYLDFIYQAYRDTEGNVEGIFFFAIDVTEQVLSRKKIEESEKRYRNFFEQTLAGVFQSAFNGRIINCNAAIAKMLKYDSPEEMLGINAAELYFSDNKRITFLSDLQAQRSLSNYELDLKCKDGSKVHLLGNIRLRNDDVTGEVFCDGILIDITERKKAEREIGWLIDNTEESFILLDRKLYITSCNRQAQTLYFKYFGRDLVKGDCILDYAQPERLDNVKKIYESVLEGSEETTELILSPKDAEDKIFFLKYKPAKDEDGQIIGVFISIIDITEQKKSEQQLIVQEKRYRSLVEHGADVVAVFSLEGKLTYISPTINTVLGYSEEEVMNLDMFSLLHPEDAKTVEETWNVVLSSPAGRTVKGPTGRMLHKNGSWRWIEATVTNMLHDPVLNGIVDNFRDVTEKIEADQLREFERRDKEALINTTEDLIWSVSSDFKLIAANHAFINSVEKSIGIRLKPGDELVLEGKIPDEFLAYWKALYQQALQGKSFIKEIHSPGWDIHPETWSEIRFNPIYDAEKITGIACYSRDTTATKIFQNKLVALNKKLETAQQIAHLGYWEMDISKQTLYWSNEVYNIWGVSPGDFEVTYQNYLNSIHPADREIFESARQNALDGKGKMDTEHRIVLQDGSIKYIHEKGEVIYNTGGEICGFEGTVQDITERKKTEAALIKRDSQLTLAAEMAKLGYWENDIVNDVLTFNDQFYAIYKTTAEEMGGYTMSSGRYAELFLPPEDRKIVAASIAEGIHSDDASFSFKAEHRIIYATGETGYISVHFNTIKDSEGRTIKNFGVNQDITERKKAEEKIKESNLRYQYVTKATSDAIWDWNLLTNTIYWGEGFQNMFGYNFSTGEQPINSWTDQIHPDDIGRVMKKIDEFIGGAETNWEDEYRFLKSDQTYSYVEDKGFIIRDAANKAIRLVGAMQDISKQKEEEQHLKLLESVITNSHDSVIITEAEPIYEPGPRIVYVNEAFTKMTGYTSEEVIGRSPRFLQGPKTDRNELNRLSSAMKQWQPCEVTVINYKKSGEEFWLNFSVTPVANEKGWFTHWISLGRDVTASKLAEMKLLELNERLQKHAKELSISNAELEQFAYIASHDLQEPLRMVTSFLTQLEKKYGTVIDEKGKRYIAFAVDGAKRMRQIILDLLEFSRVGRMEDKLEIVDLNEIVDEIKILFRKEIKDKHATILIAPLPKITAYKSPLRQVFQNLVSNALKYAATDVPCLVEINVQESKTHWQFAVSDNGIGIDTEYFEKIFIIFQRLHNKDQYSGTGMGLAVSKKIVENLGGKIWVASEEGKGSTFYFTILKTNT